MAKAEKIVTAAAAAFKPGKGVSVTAKRLKGAGESKVDLLKKKGAPSSVATKHSAGKEAAATASAASISKVEDLVAPVTPPIDGISEAVREAGEAAEWAAAAKPVLYNKWDEAP
jgi:hypothetical protein